MLDQNQTQQLLALVQQLMAQQRRGGGQPQSFVGVPGLSSGGLGGWGGPGDYGPSAGGPGPSGSSPAGLGAPSLGPSIDDPYGSPLNALAGLAIAGLSMAPGPAGAAGKLASTIFGLGNKYGMLGPAPLGPQWIEDLAPIFNVIPGVNALRAASRVFAPQSFKTRMDYGLSKRGIDPNHMPNAPTEGFNELPAEDPEKSLELEVGLEKDFNPPNQAIDIPAPAFTGWATEPGFIGTAPTTTTTTTDLSPADIADFVDDYGGYAGGYSGDISDLDIADPSDEYGGYGAGYGGDPSDLDSSSPDGGGGGGNDNDNADAGDDY